MDTAKENILALSDRFSQLSRREDYPGREHTCYRANRLG